MRTPLHTWLCPALACLILIAILLPPRGPSGADVPETGRYGYTAAAVLQALDAGEGPQALQAYERDMAEADARGDRLVAVRAGYAASYCAFRLALFQKTIEHGTRALELVKAAPGAAEVASAGLSVYTPLGYAYRAVGDLPQARRVLEEGLGVARAAAARSPRSQAPQGAILTALSKVAAGQGDRAAALAYAREAAQVLDNALAHSGPRTSERTKDKARRHAANAHFTVARLLLADRRPDEAAAALATASRFARSAGLVEPEAETQILSGQIALDRKDYGQAVAAFEQARAVLERRHATRLLVEANHGLTHAYDKLGKPDEALAAATRAIGLIEGMRGDLHDPAMRASFLEQRQGNYQFAVRLALRLGKPDEAFALAERSRARAFLDLLGNQGVLARGSTRALADEELRLRARLAQTAPDHDDEGESPDARADHAAAERAYRAFVERVRGASGEAAALMAVEPVTLADVQAALPGDTTLLEYLVGEHDVILWIVDRTRVEVRRTPRARASLVADVQAFRAAIASQAPLPEVERLAHALHQRLLGPVRAAIRTPRLLIVPHDVLHYLPFAALRSSQGRWLVEDHAVTTIPSASVLRFVADKGAHASHRILAVGNPELGPALALRYAEREARAIAERFPAATTALTRAEATEARVKQLGAGAGVLHLAVHGELNEDDPMASALLLVPGEGEDGRLEVRELFAMELTARLVVLSACETGLGRLSRGDELVGLQRAFLYAGTAAVVTTLWKVDDRASYLLMRGFYEHLAARGPAEALRAAQRALMVDFAHPFAWAAFAVTGAPR